MALSVAVTCSISPCLAGPAPPRVITIPERDYASGFWGPYFRALLEAALDATTNDYGPYVIAMWNHSTTRQERELRELQRHSGIDVTWSMTNRERESTLRPIRIPLVKGLLGYRICLVRQHDLPFFSGLEDPAALRNLVAGQGAGWPDTDILRTNGFPVMEGRDHEGLFGMLSRGRFDYFPRGITEIWDEVDAHQGIGLAVEPRFLLYYPTAVYFFVRKEDEDLARRITDGLEAIIRSGRFSHIFNHYNRRAIEQSRLAERIVIRLENPFLPEGTPLDRPELWYQPETASP